MFDVKLNEKQQEQFEILAAAMDKREKPFKLLKDYEAMHGFIPAKLQKGYETGGVLVGGPKFMASYEEFKRVGSWRDQDGVMEKVLKSAVKAASKPGRNAPCPCGSEKKFKKCCGR